MNTETLILTHLISHEGQTPAQISKSIGRTYNTVRFTLQKLATVGEVWRDEYTRYFTSVPNAAEDARFVELSDKAYGYQNKNWWNKAADTWLLAFDCTKNPGLREKAITCRKSCISMANFRIPKPEPDFPEKSRKRR
ncbi:MarR family transcriptional regulator [Pantoea endophytica]